MRLKFTISLLAIFALYTNVSAQNTRTFLGGGANSSWSNVANWDVVPSAGDDIVITANVTYDEVNDYTGSPTVYGSITVNSGVTITIDSGKDLCFNNALTGSGGRFTVAGDGQLVHYKPTSYTSVQQFDLEGNFRVYNNISISIGTDYFTNINVKDGGVFYLELPSGSTPMEFDEGFVIEAGGAFYIENEDAALNIGRGGGSGSITVQAGGTLGCLTDQAVTVNFNNSSSSLTFESGANFVEGGSSWTFAGSASPLPKPQFKFVIEGQSTNTAVWHQFSFPFDLTATTEFATDMPYNTTSGQENLYKWNSGNNGTEWTGWETYTSSTMTAGDIFTIYAGGSNYPYSGNSQITLSDDIDWAGRTYSSTHSMATGLYYNPGTGSGGNPNDLGWSAIPNPYPAHLKVSSIITELQSKSFSYHAVHIWDPSADQYIAYVNGGGGIISSTDGGAASAGTYDQLVPPGRFFWVKTIGTINIDVTESMRAEPSDFTTPINLLHGLKNQAELFKLELSSNASTSHLTYVDRVGFAADTVGRSDAYALRSFNPDIPRLYEVLPDGNASELCINSIDLSHFGTRTVAVETNKPENLTIALDTSTVSGLSHLYLLDHKLNITTDLLQNSYAFTHNENDATERFSLSVNLSGIGVEEVEAFSVGAYFAEDQLRLKFSEDGRYDLHVYNLTGVQVYETALEISGNVDWSQTLNLPAGIYVVQINNAYGQPIHTQKLMK